MPQARKKFEADRKAEEEHRKATLGSWEWNEAAGGRGRAGIYASLRGAMSASLLWERAATM